MMALCIMGHSAYAVNSTAGQNNTNNLSEQAELGNLTDEQKEQTEKLDNAMQKMNTIKNRVLESEDLDLDELKAFRMQLDTMGPSLCDSDGELLYFNELEAKYNEYFAIHPDVSRLVKRELGSLEQKAWEGLTDEQRDQAKKKVVEAIKELRRQRLISRNLNDLEVREQELDRSLMDSNGYYPYSNVPEMAERYKGYRTTADFFLDNFADAQVRQWYALTDEQRDQEKEKIYDARQRALNIDGQVLANQALEPQDWNDLNDQLDGVHNALFGQYYRVPALEEIRDDLYKLFHDVRDNLDKARGGWVPVKQTRADQKQEKAKLDEKKRMMSKNDVKE